MIDKTPERTPEQIMADLENEVLNTTPTDTLIEKEWLKVQLTGILREEQQAMAAFRLWKAMRDDEKMKKTAEEIRKLRAMQAVISLRSSELNGTLN